MDTSERLKVVRGSMTQAEFAQKIGVHKNSLGRYERGESSPDMETIAKVCLVFGISPQWLVLGEGDMMRTSPFSVVLERPGAPIRLPVPPQNEHLHERLHERQHEHLACPMCQELRTELAAERQERRELTAEVRLLWKENAHMREKVAQLEALNRKTSSGIFHGPEEAAHHVA